MHPGSFSATSKSSTASGCSPLRVGKNSQERCAASHAFGSTSSEAVIAAGEGHVRFWTNSTQVN